MSDIAYIAVMDYLTASIKKYNVKLIDGWNSEDVENWLYENTDYSDSECFYMCSESEIKVNTVESFTARDL